MTATLFHRDRNRAPTSATVLREGRTQGVSTPKAIASCVEVILRSDEVWLITSM